MNNVTSNLIISADVVKRKIRRIAFEIAERNLDCESMIVAGISGNGVVVAKTVIQELKQIISFPIEFITIEVDKSDPLEAHIESGLNFDNKTIVVVDDVANSGRTLLFALKPFLAFRPKTIQTVVLVERSHKLFPVQSDYVGLSLATTLQEHITVKTEGDTITGAWLH